MSSFGPSVLAPLDDSLALLSESLQKVKAAQSVDLPSVIEQLKRAAESARKVRAIVSAELSDASWQSREELDALLRKIQKIAEARTLAKRRSRLLTLATELERGHIVHRRTQRVEELKRLRAQAINELRSQTASEGMPPSLPGPEEDRWVEWACGLREPQDAETLQALRNGFARLDDFIANLEPSMWVVGEEMLKAAQPAGSAIAGQPEESLSDTTGRGQQTMSSGSMQLVLNEARYAESGAPRFPALLTELSLPSLESNTLTPHDVTPPRTEETVHRIQKQEQALCASVMRLARDPVKHFNPPEYSSPPVERAITTEVLQETRGTPIDDLFKRKKTAGGVLAESSGCCCRPGGGTRRR